MIRTRRSGVLLHISSLPSAFGIGDLGPGAYRFADFLNDAKMGIWQILPLSATSGICGNSPYCSYSAFAGNTMLISPEEMLEEGLILPQDIENHPFFPADKVSYEAVIEYKSRLLETAWVRQRTIIQGDFEFRKFCTENAHWLNDYALFVVLKDHFQGAMWSDWPWEIKNKAQSAVNDWNDWMSDKVMAQKFFQYLFFKQWTALKAYCNSKNIQIIGDMPIYVSYDSADVWANPGLFKLDGELRPTFVAGVPPDYFSSTGQLWGNPIYNWDALRGTGYHWWVQRFIHNLNSFDMIRLDHFRGFVGYWEVPSSETTAVNGHWVDAPARDFFDTLMKHFPYLPIIAEDLGIITPAVREIMAHYGFPGMKVLIFAFGQDLATNPYAPHNLTANSIVYTGTHDNNTVRGWFRQETTEGDRDRVSQYIGHQVTEHTISWEFIRLAMMSVSAAAIIPMQDILMLGEEARMNLPAVTYGNWEWRILPEQLSSALADRLSHAVAIYGRD